MSKIKNALQHTQQNFAAYLLQEAADIFPAIVPPPRGTVADRMQIYGDAYWLRLTQILERHYPTLLAYFEKPDFVALGRGYLDTYPSDFANVRYFGDKLTHYLRQTAEYAEQPYLAECADFEWTLSLAADCNDAIPITNEMMQNVPADAWPELRFQLHPSVFLRHYDWNVLELWVQAKAEQSLSPWRLLASDEDHDVMIWRVAQTAYYQAISPAMTMVIRLLQQGQTCSDVCEALLTLVSEDEVPNTLMQAIHFLLGREAITQIL
jgi:hypothetical protein